MDGLGWLSIVKVLMHSFDLDRYCSVMAVAAAVQLCLIKRCIGDAALPPATNPQPNKTPQCQRSFLLIIYV